MSWGLSGPAWQLPTIEVAVGQELRGWSPRRARCRAVRRARCSRRSCPRESTSMTRLPLPAAISVLPSGMRRAPKTSVPWPSWPCECGGGRRGRGCSSRRPCRSRRIRGPCRRLRGRRGSGRCRACGPGACRGAGAACRLDERDFVDDLAVAIDLDDPPVAGLGDHGQAVGEALKGVDLDGAFVPALGFEVYARRPSCRESPPTPSRRRREQEVAVRQLA